MQEHIGHAEPMPVARMLGIPGQHTADQLTFALFHAVAAAPVGNRLGRKYDENSLAAVFDRRKPLGLGCQRRWGYTLQIEFAFLVGAGGLETGKTDQSQNFAQAVYEDDALDRSQTRVAGRVPVSPRQRLGK